jgi:hypothetical protein
LMATVAAIALSTPAWAHDPAEAPIDTGTKAILLDPFEAPIDTEMKIILWLENIEASLRENTAAGDNAVRAKSWRADVRAPMSAFAASPAARR